VASPFLSYPLSFHSWFKPSLHHLDPTLVHRDILAIKCDMLYSLLTSPLEVNY
jgi:hypothetical protein